LCLGFGAYSFVFGLSDVIGASLLILAATLVFAAMVCLRGGAAMIDAPVEPPPLARQPEAALRPCIASGTWSPASSRGSRSSTTRQPSSTSSSSSRPETT
jgi:hypothetical protein